VKDLDKKITKLEEEIKKIELELIKVDDFSIDSNNKKNIIKEYLKDLNKKLPSIFYNIKESDLETYYINKKKQKLKNKKNKLEKELKKLFFLKRTINNGDTNLLSRTLDEEDLKIVKEAYLIIKEQNNIYSKILIRSLKDVISMCRYINMSGNNKSNNIDYLSRRVEKLKLEIDTIKDNPSNESAFNYYVDIEGMPKIVRDLEGIDYPEYSSLRSLLIQIKNNPEEYEENKIYEIHTSWINLILTKINNKIFIYGVDSVLYGKEKYNEELLLEDILNNYQKNNKELNILYENLLEQQIGSFTNVNLYQKDEKILKK